MEYDIAFEGGGSKGAVFVGALEEFERRGHTVRRFVGTSAGAITAALLAAGHDAAAMREWAFERLPDGRSRMASFMDVPDGFTVEEIEESVVRQFLRKIDLPFIPFMREEQIDDRIIASLLKVPAFRQVFSFVERGGVFAGKEFRAWLREKLELRTPGAARANLREFARLTKTDLSLIVSDTTGREMIVLNERTAPDCPVEWAVRMSMSIPFVWQEVVWRKEWGTYRGRDVTGHVMVDGGVLSNFPLDLLSSEAAEIRSIMGDTDPSAVPNLGLLIDEELDVRTPDEQAAAVHPEAPPPVDEGMVALFAASKPALRLGRLLDTMMGAHDRAVIQACMANHEVCRLPAKGYGTTEFNMSNPRIQTLIDAGRRAATAHFDGLRA